MPLPALVLGVASKLAVTGLLYQRKKRARPDDPSAPKDNALPSSTDAFTRKPNGDCDLDTS